MSPSPAETNTAATTGRWWLLGALALMLLVAGHFGYRWLVPDERASLAGSSDCELSQGCSARGVDRELHLRLLGAPASHQPFMAEVQYSGTADAVTLDLQGTNMFMGLNRYPLTRQADGRFRGAVQLPVCTTGRMRWRVRVLVDEGARHESADFTFWAE